jgi:hypothetical protein
MLKLADNQQGMSRVERVRESSFNLAEGSLYSQSQILARNWPADSSAAYPSVCDSSAAQDPKCPDKIALTTATGNANSIFSSADFGSLTGWKLWVRDNGSGSSASNGGTTPSSTYTQSVADAAQGNCQVPCSWDANADRQMWVRAEATVRGKTRKMVALLQLEQTSVAFPANAVTAGWASTSNNGNKAIVTTQDGATGSQVVLRCTNPPPGGCNQIQREVDQISPDRVTISGTTGNAITSGKVSLLITSADHTYTTCPSSTDAAAWTGIVYLNIPAGTTCHIKATVNTPTAMGIIIVARGVIALDANTVYYGIIYHLNLDNVNTVVVDTSGNPNIYGGIAVDGPGGVNLGSASGNTATVNFRAAAFGGIKVNGTAGLVQNTWRELANGQ